MANKVDPQLQKKLAEMKARWNQGKTESRQERSGGTTAGFGRHLCRLTAAPLIQGANGLAAPLEFTVIEGDDTGEKAVVWLNFDTDDKVIFAQRNLRKLGEDVDEIDDPSNLPAILEGLVKRSPTVRISIKAGGDQGQYTNVYIDKLISDGSETATDGGFGEGSSDESGGPEGESGEAAGEASEDAGEGQEAEEAGGEGEGEGAEAEEEIEVGSKVSYEVKGKPQSGTVKKILDDDTVNVLNAKTRKMENVDREKVRVLAEIEE